MGRGAYYGEELIYSMNVFYFDSVTMQLTLIHFAYYPFSIGDVIGSY